MTRGAPFFGANGTKWNCSVPGSRPMRAACNRAARNRPGSFLAASITSGDERTAPMTTDTHCSWLMCEGRDEVNASSYLVTRARGSTVATALPGWLVMVRFLSVGQASHAGEHGFEVGGQGDGFGGQLGHVGE